VRGLSTRALRAALGLVQGDSAGGDGVAV
jgi:hypothetical protein